MFTDEDLRKLKGFVTIDDFYKAEGSHYMRPLIKGLIARLEASEIVMETIVKLTGSEKLSAYQEWRKSAGK